MRFVFLGTGGGRYVMAQQVRSTAGFQVELDDRLLHVDPGPGALLKYRMSGLDPRKLDAVLVSHMHPDHCTDALVLCEAMTGGTKAKRGALVVNPSFSHFVSGYHREVPRLFSIVRPGDSWEEGIRVTAVPCEHGDPETVGFFIQGQEGSVYYTSDTDLLPEHRRLKADVLVSNFTTMDGEGRMGIDEHVDLVMAVRPRKVVLTHFGINVLKHGPESIASELRERTGVDVVAARDGMRLQVDLGQTVLGRIGAEKALIQ